MKKKTAIVLGIILIMAVLVCAYACGKNSFFSQRGKFLGAHHSDDNTTEGAYRTVCMDGAISAKADEADIYEVGKDVLVTVSEIEQASVFYTLSGYSEAEASELAVSYMEKYNALYAEALRNGYTVTAEDVEERVQQLKEMFSEAEQADQLKALIEAYGSEDAYWEYEKTVYAKSLPIEQYRVSLEEKFKEETEKSEGSDAYLEAWNEWYDQYQKELAASEEFVLAANLSSEELAKQLKNFAESE